MHTRTKVGKVFILNFFCKFIKLQFEWNAKENCSFKLDDGSKRDFLHSFMSCTEQKKENCKHFQINAKIMNARVWEVGRPTA